MSTHDEDEDEQDAPGAVSPGAPGERLHYGSRDPDLPTLVALDPTASHERLLSISPAAYARDASPDLILAILAHPACTPSLAGRYAIHSSAKVRMVVARFQGIMNASTLSVLALDADADVARVAGERLAEQERSRRRFG